MKKFMNFIGEGVPAPENFLHAIRRVTTTADFWSVCETHLDHAEPLSLEPAAVAEAALDLPAAF